MMNRNRIPMDPAGARRTAVRMADFYRGDLDEAARQARGVDLPEVAEVLTDAMRSVVAVIGGAR